MPRTLALTRSSTLCGFPVTLKRSKKSKTGEREGGRKGEREVERIGGRKTDREKDRERKKGVLF